MSKFAAETEVPAEKSRAEIEATLDRYGATSFFYGTEPGKAIVGFRAHNRFVRMILPVPQLADYRLDPRSTYKERSEPAQRRAYEQAVRTKWRCLLLVIKAKLETVESGISDFESEFLAHIMTPDGGTIGEKIRPQIAASYESGKPMQFLLGAP